MKVLLTNPMKHGTLCLLVIFSCTSITAQPQKNLSTILLEELLALPAPPPKSSDIDAIDGHFARHPMAFYDLQNPPSEDSSIEDLIDYFTYRGLSSDEVQVSQETREKLLGACQKYPEVLPRLLDYLPKTLVSYERVKRIHDSTENIEKYGEDWHQKIHGWLRSNSNYYIDELVAIARGAIDDEGYVSNEKEIEALTRLSWDMAEPVLNELAQSGQIRTKAFSLGILYEAAMKSDDSASSELFRAQLIGIAADRKAPGAARNTAIDALSSESWEGQESWYLSILADNTLISPSDGIYGFSPLENPCKKNPARWVPILIKLVESPDLSLQVGAASTLVQYSTDQPSREILLPLLRWLTDPNWLDLGSWYRARFIQTMDNCEILESIPGLIWIVENEPNNSYWAARTLAHYGDPRSIPVLKKALAEEEYESFRGYYIQALLASGGISESEQIKGLIELAKKLAEDSTKPDFYWNFAIDATFAGHDSLPLEISIGSYLARQTNSPAASLVEKLLVQIAKINDPVISNIMLRIANKWQSRQMDLALLKHIVSGSADANLIHTALEDRDRFRKEFAPELHTFIDKGSVLRGFAVTLLNDPTVISEILHGDDPTAQASLLACSRLIQLPLPLADVERMLDSSDVTTEQSAQKYLLAEDSQTARRMLWDHYRDQAFIAGWRENIRLMAGNNFDVMGRIEEKLRRELLSTQDLKEVYALISNSEDYYRVLYIYDDYGLLVIYENGSDHQKVTASKEYIEKFESTVWTPDLDELGPQFSRCHHDCVLEESLHLTKARGKRTFYHVRMFRNFSLFWDILDIQELDHNGDRESGSH